MASKIKKIVVISGFLAGATVQADDATMLEHIVVEGQSSPGNGLMNSQDKPLANNVISRPAIEQKNTLNNAYQAMDLLPGVNTYSFDATGLFGGGIRMRGFNSDQIGVSVDGAPINDAGNFSVFPSELIDLENLEEISVIQGASSVDTPMVGASGGSIGFTTSNPVDVTRFRVQQSYGGFNARKSFVRADTGYLGDKRFKAFVSYSKSETDKWKGLGGADRDHMDFKAVLNLTPRSSITGGLLFNEMLNNNIRGLTKTQIQTLGRDTDFGIVPPQHLPGGVGIQTEKVPADNYYNLSLNPYRNYLATLKGRFELLDNLKLDVDPYYSYGYGTGGNELTTLRETSSGLGGGVADINHDGDSLDRILVYSGSVTETERPGVTARLHSQLGNHHLMAGYWFEYAHHRRTQPAVAIDNAGNTADPWLEDPSLYFLHKDGTPYQGRNYLTQNTSHSFFGQDDIGFLDDKLKLSLGMRYTELHRDFQSRASDGSGLGSDYNQRANYAKPLPTVGISYKFTENHQVFFSRSKNFRAPNDSIFYNLLLNGKTKPVNVTPETSTNWDLGYRYTHQDLSLAGTLFYVDYRNRIAAAFDPFVQNITNYNVGSSTTQGIELQSAWRFLPEWSIYGSLSYTESRMKEDFMNVNIKEHTAGKAFPDVPNWLAGAALQYRDGPWSANLSAKYTGERYSTLLNNETIKGYTLVSFDAGYRFPSTGWFRDPSIRFNVYNLLDDEYLNLNAGSGSTFTISNVGKEPGHSSPSYYIGAPRSFSVMLSTDF